MADKIGCCVLPVYSKSIQVERLRDVISDRCLSSSKKWKKSLFD